MNKHELAELLDDHQPFHSNLQMDCFITGLSGGTEYGMYKQALRELERRWRTLKELYIARARLNIKIHRCQATEATGFVAEGIALKAAEAEMASEDLDRTTRDAEREFQRFYAQARALKKRIGPLTSERRAKLELQFSCHRLKATAALDVMTTGRLGRNTIEAIMALPSSVRTPLWAEVVDQKQLLTWFERYEQPTLDLPELEGGDGGIKGLSGFDDRLLGLEMLSACPEPSGRRKSRQAASSAPRKLQKGSGRPQRSQASRKPHTGSPRRLKRSIPLPRVTPY